MRRIFMGKKRLLRIAFFAVVILVIIYFLPRRPVEADSGEQLLMGTFARVVAVAGIQADADTGGGFWVNTLCRYR